MAELLRNDDISLSTTVILVSENQKSVGNRRINYVIENNSTAGQTIRVAFGKTASSTSGLLLNPGGFINDSEGEGYKPTQERITAVASAAGATLTIFERIYIKD